MKNKLFLTAILSIGLATFANARIFRMGYPGAPLTGVDYSDFNTLQTDATAGDTVQVYGDIGSCTITKPLVFIGFGYNLDAHAGLQKNNSNAPSTASLNFYPGSNGSKVEGVSGTFTVGNQANSPVGASVGNISFTRCDGNFSLYTYYGNVSDVTISSCDIRSGSGMGHSDRFNMINLAVFNSILSGYFRMYNVGSSAAFFNCVSTSTSYFNPYYPPLMLANSNCLVRNCILAYANGYANNSNTVFENCFFGEALIPNVLGSNNRWNQSWTNLFQGITGVGDEAGSAVYEAFNENYYILKAGSPAINGGFSGAGTPTNCGIFGGEAAFAYKLGGVPAVPSIFRLDAASLNASTNPYNVTISVRSNN